MNRRLQPFFFSILSILVLFLSQISPAFARSNSFPNDQEDEDTVIALGLAYIGSQLNDDGGVRWVDETSSVPATLRVVLALTAAGYPQDFLQSDLGNRPIDFLAESGADWVNQINSEAPALSLARAGQLLTAISAANENPRGFGESSLDLVDAIKANYDPSTGIYGSATPGNVTDQVWGILGLSASSMGVPTEALDWLSNAQLGDGSWDDGFGSFLDTTPLAVMAFLASDHNNSDSPEVLNGLDFIQVNQQPDGGWQTAWDTTTNANTTGVMLQVINALGEKPTDDVWKSPEGNPQSALIALQKENGAIGGDFANTYSTADAIIGLSGQTLFDLGLLRRVSLGFNDLISSQSQDGGWETTGQTIDSLLALTTAGWDPATVTQEDGASPVTFITENLEDFIQAGPDAMGKALLAAVAAGENPEDFGGVNLVSRLMVTYDKNFGSFGDPANTWHQALAILGLSAAEADIPEDAVATLIELQQADGGWEYAAGLGTWPDSTALAIQAMIAAGIPVEDQTIIDALEYLQSTQTADGDWGDASTTGYVLMALNALNIPHEGWAGDHGKLPQLTLLSYQKPNGSFFFSPDFPEDNLMATSTSLMTLLSGDYLVTAPSISNMNVAGLVIDPGNAEPSTTCITFTQDRISGLALLDGSGFAYDSQDGFMNSILEISNAEGETNYWSYWQWNGREWQFKNVGASESVVFPGSIEAWHFTSWELFPSLPPDFIPNLDEICGNNSLKNYAVQQYLNYQDIFSGLPETTREAVPVDAGHGEEPTPSSIMEQTPTSPPQSTGETMVSDANEQTDLSVLPIFIIGGIAIVFAIVIIIVLRKNRP